MIVAIPNAIDPAQLQAVRTFIDAADWADGNATSGHQSALAKHNLQLPENSPEARQAGALILEALRRNPLFIAAALPKKIYPPLFNSYAEGQSFGTHVDNAIRLRAGSDFRVRTDLSATLFLENPDAYEGGALTIDGQFGVSTIKLPAGHMILYPASSLHRVEPVTRGRRAASFFWIESMVRDDAARQTLFDLDSSVQALAADRGHGDAQVIRLTGIYHNLMRRWADS